MKARTRQQPGKPELLYGLPAIAGFLELDLADTNRLLDRGVIPVFRMGGRPCSTRPILTAWLSAFAMAALEGERGTPGRAVTVRLEISPAPRNRA